MANTITGAPWSVTSTAAAGAASASKAAGAAGVAHVADRCFIGLSTGATVSASLVVNLRDGLTGAGTVLNSWTVSAGLVTALSGVNSVNIDTGNGSLMGQYGLTGTAATGMCLEFAAAGPANSNTVCTLYGHDVIIV